MGLKEDNFKVRQRRNYNAVLHVATPKQTGGWRLWVLLIVFVLILGGSVYMLFFSDYFRLREVQIDGGSEEMKSSIHEMLNWETDYMVLFDSKAFASSLENKWDELAQVNVNKVWPNKIEIVLVPEVAKIVWHSGEKLFLVNSAGIILGRIEEDERLSKYADLPVVDDLSGLFFEDGDRVVGRDFVLFLETVKFDIETSIKKEVEAFEVVETTFELHVKMKDGFSVYFDALRDPQTQVEKLSIFLKNDIFVNDYIDLRVPGKVYYK